MAETLNLVVSANMADAIREAVDSGDYATPDEVLRDALRDWSLRRRFEVMDVEELRRLVQEGAESGPGIEAEAVFAELRARYAITQDAG